ncbi:MAG TPA: glycosyltransferase family 2 protein [Candidatus Omnitrophota bacterium]|nr:glycosyltransferase family 2 protein [Candidatus Omnitrophota bacterium]
MKLSVIIPVHNEKDTIAEIVRRVNAVDLDKEIIIVDDKSTDGSREILKEFTNDRGIKIILLDQNFGKGFAIRSALGHVTGDVVIIQDADLEYNPNDFKKIIEPFQENHIHVVYGSRFFHLQTFVYLKEWLASKRRQEPCNVGHVYMANFLCIKLLNWMVFLLYGQKITDEATCYKAFRREVIHAINLNCMRFEFCPEVTAKICKAGFKIVEVPISYEPRTTEHGKKIGWKDGVAAIATLIKYRFTD